MSLKHYGGHLQVPRMESMFCGSKQSYKFTWGLEFVDSKPNSRTRGTHLIERWTQTMGLTTVVALWTYSHRSVFFTLLRGALGVVLLSNISFNSAYHGVSLFPVTAGLSPINASIADQLTSNLAAVTFASYYRSLLLDNTHVIRIPPLSCSGDDCFSYFFPGGLDSIFPRPGSYQQFPAATAYVVNDAPGYQIEFYPISSSDPQLITGDCQVFGTPFSALQICIKKVDSNLIAGIFLRLVSKWRLECLPSGVRNVQKRLMS